MVKCLTKSTASLVNIPVSSDKTYSHRQKSKCSYALYSPAVQGVFLNQFKMFGFKTSIKTENITPAIIEQWKFVYGDRLTIIELDGKKGYVKLLSEKELEPIVKKTYHRKFGLATTLFIKKVFEKAWLGGDDELIKSDVYLKQMAEIYQNLPILNTKTKQP